MNTYITQIGITLQPLRGCVDVYYFIPRISYGAIHIKALRALIYKSRTTH
ncbi:MAG: hypothetical protein AABZ32_01165 [Bacteroidota bacterium]